MTREDLERRLEIRGYSLRSYRKNVGKSNESRDWFARNGLNEYLLDSTSKGDRPDWRYMSEVFDQILRERSE